MNTDNKLERSNLQAFCRTCLQRLEESMKTTATSIRETPHLMKLLMLCTAININEEADDVYPQLLCSKCYNTLQEFQLFREMALQSNEIIKAVIESEDGELIKLQKKYTVDTKSEVPTDEMTIDEFKAEEPELTTSFCIYHVNEVDDSQSISGVDESTELDVSNGGDAMFEKDTTSASAMKRKRKAENNDTEMQTQKEMSQIYVNKEILNELDATNLFNAIKMVLIDKQAERRAAAARGIVRTTLRRHLNKVKKHFPTLEGVTDDELLAFVEGNLGFGGKPLFSEIQEKELVRYIITCDKMNYGLSINNIRFLAYNFAVKIGLKFPACWAEAKMATKDWYYAFLRRHPNLKLRKPQPTSAARSKEFCEEAVREFFSNLQQAIAKSPVIFEPTRVWNMDEIGLPTVPTNVVKVVAEEGAVVGQLSSAEKATNVTMAVAISAAGNTIPPMFLFPRKNMESVFLDNAPSGSIGYANVSGWMDTDHFILYMKHFIKHTSATKTNPLLLIMDNHISHMSIEVVDLCIANGIEVVTLPPHCNRLMQPLDVSVFGPFKRAFSQKCMEWCQSHVGRVLEIHHMPGLADKVMMQVVTQQNIQFSFEVTGIYPLNASTFSDDVFFASNISGESRMASASTSSLRSSAMNTVILTSPQKRSELLEATNKSADGKKRSISQKPTCKKAKKQHSHQVPSSEEEDRDCCLCLELMPKKLNSNNSIHCNKCDRPYHLKCIDMGNRGYYTCRNCDSDLDISDE